MPNYISLCRWTAAGSAKLKDSPKRLDAARKSLADGGVKILHFFMTMGEYDMVLLLEAASDEALAKAMVAVIATGSIASKTSRAFNEEEYRRILGSLS